jgi:hypothetical protein
MKFVKDNLTLIVCGVVAVLVLAFAFAPIPYAVPGFVDDLTTSMKNRFSERDLVNKWSKNTIELPGWPAAKGIPPQAWVDVKNELITKINSQQKEVENLARQFNVQGRLDPSSRPERPVPLLPIPLSADMSRIGKPLEDLLPAKGPKGDPMGFKDDYNLQFQLWRGLLSQYGPTKTLAAETLPPNSQTLVTDFAELQKIKAGPGGGTGMSGGMGVNTVQQNQELWTYEKARIAGTAAKLRMYVEQDAFQVRGWSLLDSEPNPSQIFEGLVDSWLQSDVVKAILTLNVKENPNGFVATAPVKRLTSVVIGNGARVRFLNSGSTATGGGGGQPTSSSDPGSLFFTSSNANAGATLGGPVAMTPVAVQGGTPAAAKSPSPIPPTRPVTTSA